MPVTKKKLEYDIKDEDKASRHYSRMVKHGKTKEEKRRFKQMAEDEAKHARWLREMLESRM